MKKAIFISMIVAAFAFVSVSSIHAQVTGVYRANIPFDFSVGKKQYPAGHYNVEVRGVENKYFVLRDSSGRRSYLMNTNPGSGVHEDTAGLDFQRIGTGYYLRTIQAVGLTSLVPIFSSDDALAQNRLKNKITLLLENGK
jgi:hypothetical protein